MDQVLLDLLTSNRFQSWREVRGQPRWLLKAVVACDAGVKASKPFEMLDNDILDVFRRENFRLYPWSEDCRPSVYNQSQFDMSQELYNQLTPALRLASMMLARGAPFLVRIVADPTFDPEWTPSPEDYKLLDTEMTNGGRDVKFLWGITESPLKERSMAVTSPDLDLDALELYGEEVTRHHIAIRTAIFDAVEDEKWKTANRIQRMTILAYIGILLAHEVVHLLWKTCHGDYLEEPQVWPEDYSELGYSFNIFLFGTEIRLPKVMPADKYLEEERDLLWRFRHLYDGCGGLMAYLHHCELDNRQADTFIIADESLISFFDKNAWKAEQFLLQVVARDLIDPYLSERLGPRYLPHPDAPYQPTSDID